MTDSDKIKGRNNFIKAIMKRQKCSYARAAQIYANLLSIAF